MKISSRVSNITPSATVALTGRVAEMKAAGVDVISYSAGEPDFDTPENIRNAGKAAIDSGKTRYTIVSGIAPLRQAICEKLKKDNNVEYTPAEISVGTGAKQPLFNILLALCEEGDEVILPTPCWVSYVEMIKLAGAKPVLVPTLADQAFDLDLDAIEAAITPNTRVILVTTPNNPTGAVYSEEKLRKLSAMSIEHDLMIVCDEIYEKLVYGDAKHFSLASISPEAKEHAVIINGFSKAYAMTGWRIGYAAGPAKLIKGINALQSHATHAPNSITQWAAVEALTGPQDSVEMMRQEFEKRQQYILERLNAMPGVSCAPMKGAFYAFPSVAGTFGKKTASGKVINNDSDLADYLLDDYHVALVPGFSFEAPGYVRLSYASSMEDLKEGMDRMEKALIALQ